MMSKHNTKVTEMTEDSNFKDLIIKTFPNITDLNSVDKNGETYFTMLAAKMKSSWRII